MIVVGREVAIISEATDATPAEDNRRGPITVLEQLRTEAGATLWSVTIAVLVKAFELLCKGSAGAGIKADEHPPMLPL